MSKSNRITLPKTIENIDLSTLRTPDGPIHKDDLTHVFRLIDSFEQFDIVDPIIVGPDRIIIDGVQRVKAALRAGYTSAPAIVLNDATPSQVKALRLALNKLQTGARWDEVNLGIDIQELIGQGFDIRKLGFETAEIDALVPSSAFGGLEPVDEPLTDQPIVTRLGDLFSIGEHTILCADCRDEAAGSMLMADALAAICLTDPPYNVRVRDISGLGRNKHAEFAMASGEMTPDEFFAFLIKVIRMATTHLKPGGYAYVFMDWRGHHVLVLAATDVGLEHTNTCVWVKSNAGMGSHYRSQHEFVGVFRKPGGKSVNNVKLGKYGRNRTNVWDYRGANAFGNTRDADLKDHPTVKPVSLLEDAIKDCTNRGDIVLDPFGGSGSTMLAAERCGRRARLLEIEPRYVDVTVRRMRDVFGLEAIHVETGLTFDALAERRRAQT